MTVRCRLMACAPSKPNFGGRSAGPKNEFAPVNSAAASAIAPAAVLPYLLHREQGTICHARIPALVIPESARPWRSLSRARG